MLNNYKFSCITRKIVIVSNINQTVMITKVFKLIICLLILQSVPAQQSKAENDELYNNLLAMLEKESNKDFSGTILVIRNGEQFLSTSYGFANRNNKVPNSVNTVYDIGSLTKQFTAAGILKLEMQGKLQVTDQVADYIDEYKSLQYPVTLHQLLTHSAGLPGAIGDDYEEISEDEFIQRSLSQIKDDSAEYPYEYSNVGYSLLAIIIERVSGMAYEEFLYKNLFEPASMFQTGYTKPQWDDQIVARGYQGKEDWGTPNSKNWSDNGPYLNLKGNGGILSTSGDLFKWRQALQDDAILSAEAKKKYFMNHVPEDGSNISYYGYGWVIFPKSKKGKVITHNGGNGYFFADFWDFPSTDNTIILLSNQANRKVEDLAARIARML